MRLVKYFVIMLLLLCSVPLVSCGGAADIRVSSRYDHVGWWLNKKVVNVGDKVELAVSIDDGYEGELDVYINGTQINKENGYYTFTAQKINKIEIDGNVYKSIDRVEFAHNVLLLGQDFKAMNDSLTVYYKTGDIESISDYETDGYQATEGAKKIILTFIGGDHEYKRLADIEVVNEADYLQYIKDSFSAAIERDGVNSFLATDLDHTVFQNEELMYYEDVDHKVWILNGGMSYIVSKTENLSHKFGSSGEALIELRSYMPHLKFDLGVSAQSSYENIIGSIDSASINSDTGNIELIVTQNDPIDGDISCKYVLDGSLSYIISISMGEKIIGISANTDYNTVLPDNVEWKELLSE